MRLVRRFPFLTLAVVTLLIGGVWHAVHLDTGTPLGHALLQVVSVLGAPFIWGQRYAAHALGPGAVARIAGFILGLMPYMLWEVLLATYRARRARRMKAAVAD
jgi:hypothetical protein